jgi:hypothetical protein
MPSAVTLLRNDPFAYIAYLLPSSGLVVVRWMLGASATCLVRMLANQAQHWLIRRVACFQWTPSVFRQTKVVKKKITKENISSSESTVNTYILARKMKIDSQLVSHSRDLRKWIYCVPFDTYCFVILCLQSHSSLKQSWFTKIEFFGKNNMIFPQTTDLPVTRLVYRCGDCRFSVYASCVTFSNPDSLPSSETRVNGGIRSWKKHLSEWAPCHKAIGGIYFTKKWKAETLQPGLEFDNAKPRPKSGIFKCIS